MYYSAVRKSSVILTFDGNYRHVNQDQIANRTPPMLYGCFFNRKAEDNINVEIS